MFRPTSKSAVLTRLSMRAAAPRKPRSAYTGAFETLAPPLACSSSVWRLKLRRRWARAGACSRAGRMGPCPFRAGGVGDVPERGGERRIPRVSRKHRPTAALRCLQQSHMRAEIFQVVDVQRVPPRRRSRCVFTAVSCATSSSSGNVSLSRSSTRVATCSFDARGSRRHGGRGNSRHACARAQTRRRARKPLPLRARRSPARRARRDRSPLVPRPVLSEVRGRCRRRVAARARITGHTELAIFSPFAVPTTVIVLFCLTHLAIY